MEETSVPPPPAAPPPAASSQPATALEDDARDGGDAIDTFSSYIPASLPECVVKLLLHKQRGSRRNDDDTTTNSTSINEEDSSSNNGVIEILDTDDDTTRPFVENDDSTNSTKLLFNDDFLSHTSPAVESALLSSASPPCPPNDSATIILPLVANNQLSPLQAEGAALAIAKFHRVYTNSSSSSTTNAAVGSSNSTKQRAGFFIGDGAGIGKGRQISTTILDALCRDYGHGRHLWISVSRELVQDARRDLADVGCHVDVHDGADVLDQMSSTGGKKGSKGLGAGGSLGKGVLFITYSLLVSGRRMEDIIAWLSGGSGGGNLKKSSNSNSNNTQAELERSYTGVIVFDEAHKAKNLESDTRTAKLVVALQDRLAMARVLYCSATGVSDIKHMAYATRLGLWGAANPLYPTFDSFHGALAKRGVGAMEMLALEMKRKGIFLARTLSWEGAEFHTLEVKLSVDATRSYDGASQWWVQVKEEIKSALEFMNISPPKILWPTYWSAHQRFAREMCICAKVDEVVKQALQYLANDDHAIVIGLQSTGEAGMEVALEELAESAAERAGVTVRRTEGGKIDFEDMTLSGLVSTCESVMSNFIRNHFPVALPPPDVPKVPPIPPNGFASENDRMEHQYISNLAERMKNEPPPEPIPELVERRNCLLDLIKGLDLPPNPLDDIIDRLGGVDNVAEMTGRTGRVLRNSKTGKYKYVRRGGPSKQKSYGLSSSSVNVEDENDRLNIVEKRSWMDGKKSVAIISDAASTGISLHADSRCKTSHKRRVHFTIELPWAADKAIQQLGRSHRSGQLSAPIYKMVITNLGGERRFASAVSKRMASLGALTKGDRRAASGTDMSDFDIDSVFGKRALGRVYTALSDRPISAPSRNSNVILDEFVGSDAIAVQMKGVEDDMEKRVFALAEASNALAEIGLSGDPNVVS
jgi:hypothetical protein